MTIHEDWEQVLSTMSRAEKAQLLQWIVRDLGDSFPGIESNPHVCGGKPVLSTLGSRCGCWFGRETSD